MNIKEILQESVSTRPLVIVDVQPAYLGNNRNFDIGGLVDIVNRHTGKILMFVNAEDTTGCDDMQTIYEWWFEHGLDEEKFNDIEWIDKGYGYLRSWMDNNVPESTIIKTIREMYQQKVTDSRELFGGEQEQLAEFIGGDWNDNMFEDAMSVEWLSLSKLKAMSPFYLCGGGKNECLKEVTLMCNAMNIPYKLMGKYVY